MANQWEVSGKTFLITGGASGLGALHVENFVKEGAKHVVFVDINEEQGKATAARLSKDFPGKVTFIKCDVSDETSVTKVFDTVIDRVQKLDVIFNNAGLMTDSPALWRKTCDVNVQGLISLTMKGVKHMRKDDGGAGGTIINVSSIAAFIVGPSLPIYSGTKAAVLHFSQSLASEDFYGKTGIRVMTVCFGPTETPLLQGLEDRVYDMRVLTSMSELLNLIPSQKPESAASACLELYKKGGPGTVWLSDNNQPAKDVTAQVNEAYAKLGAIAFQL